MQSATSPSPQPAAERSSQRIYGLDSIRFVCAAIVVFGHINIIDRHSYAGATTGLVRLGIAVSRTAFNGPAAVIAFFIISGFVIHFPYRGSRVLDVAPFYTRRFIRIVLPALVFYAVNVSVSDHDWKPWTSVLWSVVCEAIYYLFYPLLLQWRRRSNWALLVAVSYVAAAVVIALNIQKLSFGLHAYVALQGLTFIVGLPCWLLGCWLAEEYQRLPTLSVTAMWSVRAGVYLLSLACVIIRFHTHSLIQSACIHLDIFAIVLTLWIGLEIQYAFVHAPNQRLETAGGWSYSLYLGHVIVDMVPPAIGLAAFSMGKYTHFLIIPLAFAFSYGYHLAIERPSHRLAVKAGRAVEAREKRNATLARV